jgi:hypothetical protein
MRFMESFGARETSETKLRVVQIALMSNMAKVAISSLNRMRM